MFLTIFRSILGDFYELNYKLFNVSSTLTQINQYRPVVLGMLQLIQETCEIM